jgi:segregation and condensation protein A
MADADSDLGHEYWVELDVFEGPLDLLLHIIRKHELSILDIPMSFVLERYIEYLETMQEMELELASEYLAMAATLVYIKSRMLLPDEVAPEDEEDEDGELQDPRAELVRRLLEYKKYRQAAAELATRASLGHEVFLGGHEPDPVEREIEQVGLFELLETVAELVREARELGRDTDLLADRITVAERIGEVAERLATRRRLTFRELLDEDFEVFDVVITFLALLEMARLRMVRLVQGGEDEQLLVMEAPRAETAEGGEDGLGGGPEEQEGEDG